MLDNGLMRPVGEPMAVPAGAIGKPGWSWGWASGGRYLTIAGSAHRRPELGATIGDAYRFGPDGMDTLALVVAVPHAGVTVTGVAYRILQLAEPIPAEIAVVPASDADLAALLDKVRRAAPMRPQFDADDRCIGCHAHIADPCDPGCPYAAEDTYDMAETVTAEQDAAHGTGDGPSPAPSGFSEFDRDNRCTGCGAHIADPCDPDCPRMAAYNEGSD